MKTFVLLLMITTGLSARDWKPLFNGRDTEGRVHVGDGNFLVENGLLKSREGASGITATPMGCSSGRLAIRNFPIKPDLKRF